MTYRPGDIGMYHSPSFAAAVAEENAEGDGAADSEGFGELVVPGPEVAGREVIWLTAMTPTTPTRTRPAAIGRTDLLDTSRLQPSTAEGRWRCGAA